MEATQALMRLQEADLAIMRVRKRLDEMPEKQAILAARKRIREVADLLGRVDALIAETDREIKRHEDEAAAFSEKIDSEQQKILSGSVTNPKEVQHISRELDSLGRQKEKLENAQFKLMEKREKAAEQRDKVVAAVEDAQGKEKALVVDFQRKGGDMLREIERLQAERAAVGAAMDPALLAEYEAAREAKHGVGVGVLEDAMCSACRVSLPAERVTALKEAGPIGTCPNCRRILVTEKPDKGSE